MPAPIYLVRHGETLWNAAGRMQGMLDSPLTELGESQARMIGRRLRERVASLGRDSMIASPLQRCRRSAALIAAELEFDPARCRYDERLREISWGAWDGLTFAEIEARAPGAMSERRRRQWRFQPPGGESYEMAAERAMDWLQSVAAATSPLIVVSHGAIGRLIRGLYTGLSAEETLIQTEPQDAFFRLANGRAERIDA